MFTRNSATQAGMLAGVIAIMIALATLELVSRAIGPWPLFSQGFVPMLASDFENFSGEFAHWLMRGNLLFRFALLMLSLFLVGGAALGAWVIRRAGNTGTYSMQAGAILLIASITWWYVSERELMEFYFQEVAIALAIAFLVFAIALSQLLTRRSDKMFWRVAQVIALISLFVILQDVPRYG